MAYTPIIKSQLEALIAAKFGKPDGVTYNGDAIVTFLTDNIQTYTKTRLDEVETALDTLLSALTAMANAFSIPPVSTTPVLGGALATALTALVTAASVNQSQREIDKTAQDALKTANQTPYFDGVK